jgi:hypothetical protein
MSLRASTSTIDECTGSDLGTARKQLYEDAGDAAVVFAMELALAEATRRLVLRLCWFRGEKRTLERHC